MFADRAQIYVRSGKGGDGHVSFRREKYVPNGGPDGGDGGNGGDVILRVDDGVNTLADYRHIRKYKAEDGKEGGKKNCRGKNGADIILKMPKGTVVKEAESGKVIVDLSGDIKEYKLLTGGRGGNGQPGCQQHRQEDTEKTFDFHNAHLLTAGTAAPAPSPRQKHRCSTVPASPCRWADRR